MSSPVHPIPMHSLHAPRRPLADAPARGPAWARDSAALPVRQAQRRASGRLAKTHAPTPQSWSPHGDRPRSRAIPSPVPRRFSCIDRSPARLAGGDVW